MEAKKRLGRGLAALIGDDLPQVTIGEADAAAAASTSGLKTVPVAELAPSPDNPRKVFDEAELEELARSIAGKGVLQPVVARPARQGAARYEIVAGERRWRAAQRAGVHEIPVVVRDLSDAEALEIMLIENIQRSDLNAMEEALGYARLMEQFNYTQQQLAETLSKSRSHVANTLRLLGLPDAVKRMVANGELSAGHARALIVTDDPVSLAEKVAQLGLSVRETEKLARGRQQDKPPRKKDEKSPDIAALEKRLEEALGLKAEIRDNGRGAGRLCIGYRHMEQLDDIIGRLLGS